MEFPKGLLQPLTTESISQKGGRRSGNVQDKPGMFGQLMLQAAQIGLRKKKRNSSKGTKRNRRALRRTRMTYKKRSSK